MSCKRTVVSLVCFLIAAAASAQIDKAKCVATTRAAPQAYGTDSYTVTTIPAAAFYPATRPQFYNTSGADLGRNGFIDTVTEFYAPVDIPGGAIIDYIGLNTSTDADFAYGVQLVSRFRTGGGGAVATFSSTAHGWGTDFNASPIGYLWDGDPWNFGGAILLVNVEEGSFSSAELFGSVEIWWKRSIYPPPDNASFDDVPTSHPFFQFVEALNAAGITGGCSVNPPLYCPDNPLTRGQMAVFLAKALGLHWPGGS